MLNTNGGIIFICWGCCTGEERNAMRQHLAVTDMSTTRGLMWALLMLKLTLRKIRLADPPSRPKPDKLPPWTWTHMPLEKKKKVSQSSQTYFSLLVSSQPQRTHPVTFQSCSKPKKFMYFFFPKEKKSVETFWSTLVHTQHRHRTTERYSLKLSLLCFSTEGVHKQYLPA